MLGGPSPMLGGPSPMLGGGSEYFTPLSPLTTFSSPMAPDFRSPMAPDFRSPLGPLSMSRPVQYTVPITPTVLPLSPSSLTPSGANKRVEFDEHFEDCGTPSSVLSLQTRHEFEVDTSCVSGLNKMTPLRRTQPLRLATSQSVHNLSNPASNPTSNPTSPVPWPTVYMASSAAERPSTSGNVKMVRCDLAVNETRETVKLERRNSLPSLQIKQ
eukprot:GILI01022370.1.p1 GENE.GILI01022370.1~~GILI01022370.1.p1  ORF type:complete len:213 (-),score=20.26 GILI01022370.1:26-664(-)